MIVNLWTYAYYHSLQGTVIYIKIGYGSKARQKYSNKLLRLSIKTTVLFAIVYYVYPLLSLFGTHLSPTVSAIPSRFRSVASHSEWVFTNVHTKVHGSEGGGGG